MEMETCLKEQEAMTAYNMFHHAFPDYKNNEHCGQVEIDLRNKLERFLIACGN